MKKYSSNEFSMAEIIANNIFSLEQISFAIKIVNGPFLYVSKSFSSMLKDFIKTKKIIGKTNSQIFIKSALSEVDNESVFLNSKKNNYFDEVVLKKKNNVKTFFWLKFKIFHPQIPKKTNQQWIGIISVEATNRKSQKLGRQKNKRTIMFSELVRTIKKVSQLGLNNNRSDTLNQLISDIETISTRDFLTGLYNRKVFEETLKLEIKKAVRYHYSICLLVIDIDNFKAVNDNYGHVSGDEILKDLSKVLTSSLRETDYVCRWGGEEFAIILQDCTIEDGQLISEKILNNVRKKNFKPKKITISIGLAQLKSNENMTAWFVRADEALNMAKRKGKDRVILAR